MQKIPVLTKDKAEEIAAKWPTPFYIYDEKGIRENARNVNRAFAWNSGFREYFAVKATPNPFIMQILKEEGCGFDCSSMAELLLGEAVGAGGDLIMFSSNETPQCEYEKAAAMGAIIIIDDITHIGMLDEVFAEGYPDTMSVRFNPGGIFRMSNGIMDNPWDSKYGMTKEQVFEAFGMLKERGVKNFGIHAFLASNTVSDEYYPVLARKLFALAVEAATELDIRIAFINLSGGVGIDYTPEERANDIFAIGEGVRQVYDEILTAAGMGNVAIYTEMGRFMLGPFGSLVTRAIHKKHIYKEYIGVDACAANLMRPAMYGAYHHITVLGKENEPAAGKFDVVGSLCENNDKFAVDRELPAVENGDLLYIHDTGAHGHAMGYNYNGRLRSAELLLKEDGSVQEIRRAETLDDYFVTFDTTEYATALITE